MRGNSSLGSSWIEPPHKGFAVLVAKSKLLTNMGISVGRSASKSLLYAPFCRLLAAKWQPDSDSSERALRQRDLVVKTVP